MARNRYSAACKVVVVVATFILDPWQKEAVRHPIGDGFLLIVMNTGSREGPIRAHRVMIMTDDGFIVDHPSLSVICTGIDIPVRIEAAFGEEFRLNRNFIYHIEVVNKEPRFAPRKRMRRPRRTE